MDGPGIQPSATKKKDVMKLTALSVLQVIDEKCNSSGLVFSCEHFRRR